MECFVKSCLVIYYLLFGMIFILFYIKQNCKNGRVPYARSRKYDIEAEARKIYGEDLQSVLKRFRKTPEYLSILEEKLNDLKMNMNYIASNIHAYYDDKISDKVEEILGANHTYVVDAKRKSMRDRYTPFRRQSETSEIPKKNMTGVERLDSYKKLRSALSVDERNHFKDVGYEFAGHIIHAIINAGSGDEVLLQSTLLPYGSDDDKHSHTTHQHQVTHTTTAIADENPSTVEGHELHTHPPDVFRHYQQRNIL